MRIIFAFESQKYMSYIQEIKRFVDKIPTITIFETAFKIVALQFIKINISESSISSSIESCLSLVVSGKV